MKAQLSQPVRIDAGVYGAASWNGVDWDSPFRTWVSGPVMSSWIYRKPIGNDATLVGWLEVRLWNTGAVEVLPWVENGYVLVPGHINKNATWTFTLGGTQRESLVFDLAARTRAVLISGTKLAHWLGTDPGVTVRHDAAYLMQTKLVPHYSQAITDSVVAGWSDSITSPQEQGRFPSSIGAAGYHPSIGLLPQWDAMYLTNGSAKVWRIVQQQGYRAGRWGIYHRDENNSNKPARASTTGATGNVGRVFGQTSGVGDAGNSSVNKFCSAQTGTVPPIYKTSHHPSMGFMAALVTGRFFHVETAQFVASINGLYQSDIYRQSGAYEIAYRIRAYMQPRGFGWGIRSLAQAIAISPDGDPMRTEFESHFNGTIVHNHARYVAQPSNPQGFMEVMGPNDQDYTGIDSQCVGATWMIDFIVQSMGYARHLTADAATEASKLTAWFNWAAQSVVGRFGGVGATEYLYRDAAPQVVSIAPADFPDYATGAGPWYANWGQLWQAAFQGTFNPDSYGPPPPRVKEIGDGTLRGGAIGNGASYWANLQPALAYCVDHGAAGAAAAWSKLISAPNYGSGVRSFFSSEPEWGVFAR